MLKSDHKLDIIMIIMQFTNTCSELRTVQCAIFSFNEKIEAKLYKPHCWGRRYKYSPCDKIVFQLAEPTARQNL